MNVKQTIQDAIIDFISTHENISREQVQKDLDDSSERDRELFDGIVNVVTETAQEYARYSIMLVLRQVKVVAKDVDELQTLWYVNDQLRELKSHDETKKD